MLRLTTITTINVELLNGSTIEIWQRLVRRSKSWSSPIVWWDSNIPDSSTRRCSKIGRLSASDARRSLRGSSRAVATVAAVGVIVSSAPPFLGSNAGKMVNYQQQQQQHKGDDGDEGREKSDSTNERKKNKTRSIVRVTHTHTHTHTEVFVASIIDPPSGGSMRVA